MQEVWGKGLGAWVFFIPINLKLLKVLKLLKLLT